MGEETIRLDYEREYHRLLAQIARTDEEHKQQLYEKDEFYNRIINQKDKEIEWYKSVINGILHI